MTNACPVCNLEFHHWPNYSAHLRSHSMHSSLPLNTSGRTKAQIVASAEDTWLKPAIIQTITGDHLEACHCEACIQKKLDTILNAQERELNVK